ncbi:MAG TPA: YtxH domain-containing protein [Pseudobdellovibrionaceae bacterium]|nr:YtxH domain-containing protein [Pseudobdellovibrionaceae bacterium]
MTVKKEYIPPKVGSFVDQAKSWAKDLKFSRPSPSASALKIAGLVTVGMAAGAAIAYFFDPVSGSDRRKSLKEKGRDFTKKTSETVQDTYHSAKDAITSRMSGQEAPSDSASAAQSTADLH